MEQEQGPLEGMVTGLNFWSGKKVFLTGHTGFKGSWLSIWLRLRGAELTGYALPAESPSLFTLSLLEEEIDSLHGDIRDFNNLSSAIDAGNPDIVIHMAAQSLVRPSYDDPLGSFNTNVMGTANLLEAARKCPSVKVVINITSDKCYENQGLPQQFKETDPMGGYDPYSCSKGCAELVSNSYRQSFYQSQGKALATVRAGNVIGGGDWAQDRLIPDIFNALHGNSTVIIRNPFAVRPWQHVCEPLFGYMLLAEKLWEYGQDYAEAWNFGPEQKDVKPVSWITDYICREWGKGANWVTDDAVHPHEASHLSLDIRKSRERLGWQPRLGLQNGLDWCIDWYKAYYAGRNMRELTEKQIQDYQGLWSR